MQSSPAKAKPRLLAYQSVVVPKKESPSKKRTFVKSDVSPSKMTEEEKMEFKDRLFQEADELSAKISEQIKDCNEVRHGIREQITGTKRLIDNYNQEEEEYQERMQIRK